jgi:hypothetical protein
VFDADQGRCVYRFNAKESGDAMALDQDGTIVPSSQPGIPKLTDHVSTVARLALCTAARDTTHFLRVYDVCRKNGQQPMQEIFLDVFDIGLGSSQSEPREGKVRAGLLIV